MNNQALARQRPLSLVRDPILACLDQAASHLEQHHQNPSRPGELALCDAQLQQVAGCLTMLELAAARCLVEEMRALTQAIGDPRRLKHERCTELLIAATLFLPRYLDYVRTRGQETPALLLPTINVMRFVRRAGLIPEHEFVPHALPALPAALAGPPPAAALVPHVRRLRHLYQVGLLGVIRNRALEVHLRFLSHTLDRLQQACGVREPWTLTRALLEALLNGSLSLDLSIKHMLGRVDRHLRDLAQEGSTPDRTSDETLREHLLYYLAKADPSDDAPLADLQAHYRLAGCVPGEDYLEQERQWLQTPDRGATGAVAKALLEDLAEVKAGLLELPSPGDHAAARLRALLRTLDQIALTLDVLGLDGAMRACRSLARHLPALAGGQAHPPMNRMAEQLVRIETTLQAYAQGVPGETLNRDHCENLRLAEDNTLREACQAIADIRQALEDYFDPYAPGHGQPAPLQEIRPLLRQVEGALRMLELAELAALLEPLSTWLGDGPPLRALPTPLEREPMIEAIASVEWFLEDYGRAQRQGSDMPR